MSMAAFKEIFPIGLGTNRLPITGPLDVDGFDLSVQLVLNALDEGVNYIDVAYGYSCGMAEDIVKTALSIAKKRPIHLTLKSQFGTDKTVDDVLRRAETAFTRMGVDHATFFLAWCVMNYEQFERIMEKGGLYDGACVLRSRGLIDHICFSSHATPEDTIRIIESGVFDGVTVSYSVLNSVSMRPVLDTAMRQGIGAVVMNPLGGGVIPQNPDYFGFIKNNEEQSTAQAALRFITAHPAVRVVLVGSTTRDELREDVKAFTEHSTETNFERLNRVNENILNLKNFCTGCRYCDGCPVGIPIHAYMQSYNTLQFSPTFAYNRTMPELLRNIQLCRKLYQDFAILPEDTKNPCINCGRCEDKCTQKLPIQKALEDIYKRIENSHFSLVDRKMRLNSLLNGKGYKKVGFYPGARYTVNVLELYRQFFGNPNFECLLFDSNPKQWGKLVGGWSVYAPEDIARLLPDCIIVSNYNYSDEIYQSIEHYKKIGIDIVPLHNEHDVPWGF